MSPGSGIEFIQQTPREVTLCLSGNWVVGTTIPDFTIVKTYLSERPSIRSLQFDSSALRRWDSLLLTFLLKTIQLCESHSITVETADLPNGVQGMLSLARAVPERQTVERHPQDSSLAGTVGRFTLNSLRDFNLLAEFVGATCLAFGRLMLGKARMRGSDLLNMIEECGPKAVPIISLISILVGMILAFVGAVQLKLFGAQIFIADLVGLGMAREMGAMMTAILMAGRTGAAFAAELGYMTVNDEIDALKTSGFSPIEFLVLPRIIALFLTIPLLCLYADILGILGGAIVASGLFDISLSEYVIQIQNRLRTIDFEVGIGKSAVFGILVGVAGCMRGLQCQKNAAAVGLAATSAVVTGIVYIVISDALMTLIVTTLNVFKR